MPSTRSGSRLLSSDWWVVLVSDGRTFVADAHATFVWKNGYEKGHLTTASTDFRDELFIGAGFHIRRMSWNLSNSLDSMGYLDSHGSHGEPQSPVN